MMTNAFTERKYYGEKQPKQAKKSGLKSSLKASNNSPLSNKRVRINEEEQKEELSDPDDHQTAEPDHDELTARQKQLQNLQHLMNLRESIKSSKSNPDNFGGMVKETMLSQENHDEMLKEILEREKEEIRKVEHQLGLSQAETQKQGKIHKDEQLEKVKRWQVINQKRESKLEQRNHALNEDFDPMAIAEMLQKQEEQKQLQDNSVQEIELSSPTDEETREQNMKQRDNQGKHLTFKKFLKDKHGKAATNAKPKATKEVSENQGRVSKDDGMVNLRESHPEPINEESIESEISEELVFSNQDRSFEQHPCEIEHKSSESEKSIRMSMSTLRQIKMRRSKSQGPMGRAFAYLDTRSIAESGIARISHILQRLKNFLNENYESFKEWIYTEGDENGQKSSKKSKKRVSSLAKKQLPNVEEMVRNIQNFVPQKVEEEKLPPTGRKTMGDIMKKHRTFGKTAQEMIFEEDFSDVSKDEPSFVTKQKIKKLKDDEQKLKLFEKQIVQELKELKNRVSVERLEHQREATEDQVESSNIGGKGQKAAKKKGKRRKKGTKAHHDMRRMKQEHIKKLLNKDLKHSDEEPQLNRILVKDFKSDHDSVSRPVKKSNIEEDKDGQEDQAEVEAREIHIEPLEKSMHSIKEESKKLTPEREPSLKIMPPASPKDSGILSPPQVVKKLE